MRIRLATVGDFPALERMVAAAGAELEERWGTPRMDDILVATIKYGLATGESVVLAEQDGEPIGWCARVHLPMAPEGQADGIGTWVAPSYRKDHVGRDMRRFADEHARSRGATYVTGTAAKDNVAGIRSCLAEGFEIVGYQLRKSLAETTAAPESGASLEGRLAHVTVPKEGKRIRNGGNTVSKYSMRVKGD